MDSFLLWKTITYSFQHKIFLKSFLECLGFHAGTHVWIISQPIPKIFPRQFTKVLVNQNQSRLKKSLSIEVFQSSMDSFNKERFYFKLRLGIFENLQKIIEREFIWISVLGNLPCLWKMKFEIESSLNRPTFSVGRLSLMKQCLNPNLGESFKGLLYGGREVLKLPTSLKLVRIMLETSNLLRKYTLISSSKKYNLYYQRSLNFAEVSIFC